MQTEYQNMTNNQRSQWRHNFRCEAFVLLLGLALCVCPSACAQVDKDGVSTGAIGDMIAELNSDDYLIRQRATEKLIEVGPSAIKQLEKMSNSFDEETRYRVGLILNKVETQDQLDRKKRFLSLESPDEDDCGFSHWIAFSKFAGNTKSSRKLFMEIDSDSLIDLDQLLREDDQSNKPATVFGEQTVFPSLTAYAAEMFRRLSLESPTNPTNVRRPESDQVLIDQLTTSRFISNFHHLPIATVEDSPCKKAFIAMLDKWMKHELETDTLTLAHMKIINAYRLEGFVDKLIEVVDQPKYPFKSSALETVAGVYGVTGPQQINTDFGNGGALYAINRLKPYVLSNEVLMRLPQANTKGPVDVTLGDITFQLILKLQKKEPKMFGMLTTNGRMELFADPVFCYTDPNQAADSVKRWLEEWSSQVGTKVKSE